MVAGVLDVCVVLIGPEPGDLVVWHALSQHVRRGSGALPHRVLPVLNANMPAEHRMIVIRHIACGIDSGDVGGAVLIHNDAVVDMDVTAIEKLHGRYDT